MCFNWRSAYGGGGGRCNFLAQSQDSKPNLLALLKMEDDGEIREIVQLVALTNSKKLAKTL
ncbi:hypothetical protein SAMN04515672_4378 [Natronorubrum texcoconense]|uniref:Uncharacterized protein n=1 Tax=Natronorubrum texcoconense TaxID=1095776 RepID=A0A1G9G1D3_9EURY|nr:hypothetical protein SAMN04515672_4378 [Natronorubrum texcoconense]